MGRLLAMNGWVGMLLVKIFKMKRVVLFHYPQ